MKAKNSEQIIREYIKFAMGLFVSSCLAVGTLWGFISTNRNEYQRMESKAKEYDKIYSRQIELVDKVDSLYNYLMLMGSNERLNQVMLQKVTSTHKMKLIEELEKMNKEDVQLYILLCSKINDFQDTKEAVRKATQEEYLIRNDLLRCIQDNKQASRRLSLGGVKSDN